MCFLELVYRVHTHWEPADIHFSSCTDAQRICKCSFILSRGYKKNAFTKKGKGECSHWSKGHQSLSTRIRRCRSIYREWCRCNYCRLFRDSTNLRREIQKNLLVLSKHKPVHLYSTPWPEEVHTIPWLRPGRFLWWQMFWRSATSCPWVQEAPGSWPPQWASWLAPCPVCLQTQLGSLSSVLPPAARESINDIKSTWGNKKLQF